MLRPALLAAIAAVSLARPAAAATTAENLAKYRALRQRLITEFTVVGPARGNSQPAPERDDGEGFIKWGDGTIYLGWYIGVLATEYHMITNPDDFPGADGGDSGAEARTLDELYHALLALERLDEQGDAAFPECSGAPSLNGFFIRDDVPADFHQNFPPLAVTFSDFVDPTLTNKEESQDQVYHLMMGLALVKKFVPVSVSVEGRPLRQWSIDQARRIGQHFATGLWRIRNPACNRNVNRGEEAIGYSGGTRLAFGFITDGAYLPDSPLPGAWDTLDSPTNPAYDDVDNLHMAMAIAAIGNGFGENTARALYDLSRSEDWTLYPLVHRTLYGAEASGFCGTAPDINPVSRQMLDELPAGAEPANPSGGPAPHQFTASNRFIRPKSQAYVGSPELEGMRYSGLDYLLLHNVYSIATPGTWNGSPDADPCARDDDPDDPDDPRDPDDGNPDDPGDPGRGACAVGGGARGAVAWLGLAVAIALARRRRR